MNILNKFENFELKQKDILSDEDKENCEKIQSVYEHTLSTYKKWYDVYHENLKSNDEHNYNGLKINDLSVCEKIEALDNNLIWQIYHYFSSKYGISLRKINLDKSTINYNYQASTISTTPLNYEVYVEDILKQLNGLSFENMRIKQLKEKLRDNCKNRYCDTWNIEIKGNIIKFDNLLSWSKYSWEDDYKLHILDAFLFVKSSLAWFEYGKETNFIELNQLKKNYNIHWNDIEKNIKLNSQKIKSIKLFKNGRVDVKFSSPEIAREFITEWCGYPLSNEI